MSIIMINMDYDITSKNTKGKQIKPTKKPSSEMRLQRASKGLRSGRWCKSMIVATRSSIRSFSKEELAFEDEAVSADWFAFAAADEDARCVSKSEAYEQFKTKKWRSERIRVLRAQFYQKMT
jgi:hypothetical protein